MPINSGILSFGLVTEALTRSERAAVAELVSRGKEQIVIIRPYRGGLVLHGMFYKNEVNDVGQIPRAESERVTQDEVNLATRLIDGMSNDQFVPEEYHDEYRLRVLAMIDAKLKGREITTAPQPAHKPGPVIDLMEALKQSMRKVPERKVAGTRKARKKA